MTFAQLMPAYLEMRRRLLAQGAPFGDWTISISPADAMDLQLEKKYEVGAGEHVYGATWVTDAQVPRGELWLDIQAQRTTHKMKVS